MGRETRSAREFEGLTEAREVGADLRELLWRRVPRVDRGGWCAKSLQAALERGLRLRFVEGAAVEEKVVGRGRDFTATRELDDGYSGQRDTAQRLFAAAGAHAVTITDTHQSGDTMGALQLGHPQQHFKFPRAFAGSITRCPRSGVQDGHTDCRGRLACAGR